MELQTLCGLGFSLLNLRKIVSNEQKILSDTEDLFVSSSFLFLFLSCQDVPDND